jgi:hypothetical protein
MLYRKAMWLEHTISPSEHGKINGRFFPKPIKAWVCYLR